MNTSHEWVSPFKRRLSGATLTLLRHLQPAVPPTVRFEPVPFEGRIDETPLFLGSRNGLMYFDGTDLWRVFRGRVYGITRYEKRWYVTWNSEVHVGDKPLGQRASIVSFRFEEGAVKDVRVEICPLDPELHQIDAWDGQLYVTDTANNRVLAYEIGENGLSHTASYYPNGRLADGKDSPNYAHINSVYRGGNRIYLVYHNHTEHTGRSSQVAVLDEDWSVTDIRQIDADGAHNIVIRGDRLLVCDSGRGALRCGHETLVETDVYLRGMCVTESAWILGGSEFAKRDERDRSTGYVFQHEPSTFTHRGTLRIPKCGSLFEIRRAKGVDYALSRFSSSARAL